MANASPHARPSARRLDPLALVISLTAADSGLSRRGMLALQRLRQRQLETIDRSRGAFVKVQPRSEPPLLDLGAIGRDSPLTGDYHSLIVLELVTDFPERGSELRAMLDARRHGLDAKNLADALWQNDGGEAFKSAAAKHSLDPHLLAGTLWAALKPLYESVAAAVIRHFEVPSGANECPVCGGLPWARSGDQLVCCVCETHWKGDLAGRSFRTSDGPQVVGATRLYDSVSGQRLVELDGALLAHAFDPGPLIELLQLLDKPV
ncbi:MAG: hypothetical protein H6839_16890 [Planctomycetes bacterium]|nr:hypothetical protein [Planctomycetota bacterium]